MGKKKHKKNRPLTEEEIWDDSALLRSWDEAVEEYNLYHSIHARGENVDEILKAAERDDSALEATAQSGSADEDAGAHHQDASVDAPENTRYEDGEIGDYDMGEDRDLEPALLLDRGPGEASSKSSAPQAQRSGDAESGVDAVPHEVLSEQPPDLKKLMMAWYWAGYYTRQAEEQLQ